MRITKLNQKGIGLVETLLALSIGIIVITALVSLSVFTLRSSQQSRYLLQSSKLANQELELVRAFRENSSSWDTFVTSMAACTSANCYVRSDLSIADSTNTISPVKEEIDTYTYRYFRAYDPSDNSTPSVGDQIVRIAVTVEFEVGGDIKTAHTYTDLTNWEGD